MTPELEQYLKSKRNRHVSSAPLQRYDITFKNSNGVVLKERAEVISRDPIWVGFFGAYWYTADTLEELFEVMTKEWELDKNLLG